MELLPWMAIWFRLVLFYLRGMSWALWILDVFCFSFERWVTNTPFGFLSNPVTTVGLFCKICTDFIVIGAAVVSRLSTQVVNQVPFFSCTWMGKGFALHWIILNGHPLDKSLVVWRPSITRQGQSSLNLWQQNFDYLCYLFHKKPKLLEKTGTK